MIARKIFGVIVGVVLANLIIYGWELAGHQLSLGGVAPTTQDTAVPGAIAASPLPAKLWVVAGWLVGAFSGALLAFRLARWDYAGWVVGAMVAAAGIANIVIVPHPLWMALSAVTLPFVGALLAFGVSRRWRAADLHLRRR